MNKNDYAPIAPMGWNSYDYYDTTVNEEQVRANAAYLAEHLKDAGYEYVVVDIEWYAKKAGSQRNTYQYIPYSELAIDEYSRLQPQIELGSAIWFAVQSVFFTAICVCAAILGIPRMM